MPTRLYTIDWREEFSELSPYLKGLGGVVRIRYAGNGCAPAAFLDTLKSEYECTDRNANWPWPSIRIDHEVYSVRYLSGIRDEFVRKIGLSLPEAHGMGETSASLSVMTDVEAHGDLTANIGGVIQNFHGGGDNHAFLSGVRDRWIKALCEQVANFLHTGHMMVVVNHGPRDAQDEFWRCLWRGGLEALVASGLFLVHMIDVSDAGTQLHPLAPSAQAEINLPTALGPSSRAHAVEDLTEILVREVPRVSREAARAAAQGLVQATSDDLHRLHSKYSGLFVTLAQEAG